MKRTVLISAVCLLLALFCACAVSPVQDLSGFLQNRRSLGAPLDLQRLYRTESTAGEQFWLPLTDTLSLRLFALETGALYECRVLLRRMSVSGGTLPLREAEKAAFRSECALSLQAFCGVSAQEAARLLQSLQLFDGASGSGAGTLTAQSGPFALTLQRHPLELAFSLRDTRLKNESAASVPESRPLFGDTTATRKETVPHK